MEQGKVHIKWDIQPVPEPILRFRWTESGDPTVTLPTRKGFGSHLITRTLAMEFGAEVDVDFARSGLVFTLETPLAAIAVDDASHEEDFG